MTSRPGEPDTGFTGTSGLGAGAAAFEEQQQKQEQQNQQAIAADSTPAAATETTEKKDKPIEKKLEDLTLGDKKEEQVNPEEKRLEAVTAAPPAAPATEALAAATPAPEKTTGEPVWPETGAEHPLTKFFESVGALTEEAGHNEVWGITLSPSNAFLTKLILQKFLRANADDMTKAKEQLSETLKWRKQFDPIAATTATYDKERFDGLGYILEVEGVPESLNKKDVVTFNVYGAVKDNQKTFGDLEAFLKWRVGLMERSIQKLNLAAAKEPIPDYGQGPDPYQGFQVHDYLQVSFIRQDSHVKAASKKTIETLGRYYPETLSRKFFVNVPILMGWFYTAVKLFVAKETIKKFTVLSYGNQLATELGQGIPTVYGGTAGELKEVGEGVKVE